MKKLLLVWSWNLLCMLEISFPSFISQKPSEIPIFGTFLTKFSILAYVSLKISCYEVHPCLWRHCDVICHIIVMSYVWHHNDVINMTEPQNSRISVKHKLKLKILPKMFQISEFHPLGKQCYRKRLCKMRVKARLLYRMKFLPMQ